MNIDSHLAAFCASAEAIIADGVEHARADDPHKFNTLVGAFDQSEVRRRLVIDYLPGGQVRIALQLDDADRTIEVFATTARPIDLAH